MRALLKLIQTEARLFLREPVGAFFGLAFPALILLVLGNAIPYFTEPLAELGGRRPIDIYLPVVLAMAIATVATITFHASLSAARQKGVLRRLATTPVSPTKLLTAQLIVNVGALLVGSILAFVTATIAFGIEAPRNVAGVVVAFLLGSACMCSVAILIASLSPSAAASSGIGSLVYFPMMFFAGVWTPGPAMPETARRIADFVPLGAASQSMQDSWAGAWPSPLHLAVMGGLALLLTAAAARWFRWE